MRARFLLGPAGSGKTFRCLAEIRHALLASAEGPPLILLAPKQATFQLERQLLAESALAGYTRLRILSFERLARFVFEELRRAPPPMLDEEGRVMVLRALLAKKREHLKLFRASARLTGFARQLSLVLRELQRQQLTPETLNRLAAETGEAAGLSLKLRDLAMVLEDYLAWLGAHGLQDADSLLAAATAALEEPLNDRNDPQAALPPAPVPLRISNLWLDGFAELSPQELELLATVIRHGDSATLAFCLDHEPVERLPWLSHWSVVQRTFTECRTHLARLPGAEVSVEVLARDPQRSRFTGNPVLQHLEAKWSESEALAVGEWRFAGQAKPNQGTADAGNRPEGERSIRLVACADPEAEARLAAREILGFVRAGGRFRETSVLVRNFEGYHKILQRVFLRYEIPFFLDRRELVTHHPFAELTRGALRTVAFQWRHDDWFAALKTGLVVADETEIDRLENEALARGWQGGVWQHPIHLADDEQLSARLERVRHRIVPPFQKLALRLGSPRRRSTGPELAGALREFWDELAVEEQLQDWTASDDSQAGSAVRGSVHATVWDEMNAWLDNVELAFAGEALPLRDWLPVLEAGLGGLTVGVIPPALDQVLIGAVDRSRSPDIRLAIVLGMNETVFPAPLEPATLLTEADRVELENRDVHIGASARRQLARERYYAYIACTRARQQVVLTCSSFDARGRPLNPSPFLSDIRRLFPALEMETLPQTIDWRDSEHASELFVPLIQIQNSSRTASDQIQNWRKLAALPSLATIFEWPADLRSELREERIPPALAEKIYGATLHTSVSRLEQFAACPFRFCVHSGLRAEERKSFELDAREQGSFQHDVLKRFHEQLRSEHKRWRDITPDDARGRIERIGQALMANYRDGLLQSSEETRFVSRTLTESLQDFVETAVGWMHGQYQFDPVAVEAPFGAEGGSPAWELELGDGHRLALYGRIDRVDLCRDSAANEALCVVVDYKSGQKQLDPLLVAHGIQLQLLAYLNVLRQWPDPQKAFGVSRLVPAGVFYVNLRGRYEPGKNRDDALGESGPTRKLAYQHTGRFDQRVLRRLDARADARQGDQFRYRLKNDGTLHRGSREALAPEAFEALLGSTEQNLRRIGREIFSGAVAVSPYRKGSTSACDHCDYRAVCRIDPGTHRYRILAKADEKEPAQ